MPEGYLPPADATMTTADDLKRCWNCDCYSFKVFGGVDSTQGKCFRDFDKDRTLHWVDGLMTCPQWKPDCTVQDKSLTL